MAIAGLLAAGQLVIHRALDRQQDDADIVNLAGRQRMLDERLCMLLLAIHADPARAMPLRPQLADVAEHWERNQVALRRDRGATSDDAIASRFAAIDGAHRALLAAAHDALDTGAVSDATVRAALDQQDEFLSGMDEIVARYAHEARERVVGLAHLELVLFGLVLVLLACEGLFVLRPAVRALAGHLADRERIEHELVRVTDREQQRLARELHDGLGQHLVGIGYLLKALPRAGAGPELDEVSRLVADAVDQTRSLARGLYSHALERDDVGAALRELAAHVTRVFGVPCRAEVGELPDLTTEACTQLYRIAREAAVNAARHADASVVELELTRQAERIVLAIRDNGHGIRPAADAGMGLNVMAYRAKMIRAVLDIKTGDRGTTVTCSLPTERTT